MKKSIQIKFLGNEYLVKTDADEDYVRDIASYLEEKVLGASSSVGNVKIPHPLFLATLQVADDLFRLKSEYEEYKNGAEEHTKKLVELLEEEIESSSSPDSQVTEDSKSEGARAKPDSSKGWN